MEEHKRIDKGCKICYSIAMEQTPADQPKVPYRLLEDPLLLDVAETDSRLAVHLDNLRQTEAVLASHQERSSGTEVPPSLQEVRDLAEEEVWRYIGEVGYATSEPRPEEGTTA